MSTIVFTQSYQRDRGFCFLELRVWDRSALLVFPVLFYNENTGLLCIALCQASNSMSNKYMMGMTTTASVCEIEAIAAPVLTSPP